VVGGGGEREVWWKAPRASTEARSRTWQCHQRMQSKSLSLPPVVIPHKSLKRHRKAAIIASPTLTSPRALSFTIMYRRALGYETNGNHCLGTARRFWLQSIATNSGPDCFIPFASRCIGASMDRYRLLSPSLRTLQSKSVQNHRARNKRP
jgi:hypothetical protein